MSYYNNCALIYPYYQNPGMLEFQVDNWNRYAGELASSLRLIVVDDCSPEPAEPIFAKCKWKNKSLYRVQKRQPWHQHGARNVGAKEACEKGENWWLFLSDLDIVLTPETAAQMLNRKLDPAHAYTMERTFAPDFTERKVHPNTFLCRHAAFWQINGYDEDFCGTYGGDGAFARQLFGICPQKHLDDVVLIGYGRRQRDGAPIMPDADTVDPDLDRNEYSRRYQELFRRKRDRGDMRSRNPLRLPYVKVL